MTSDKSLHRLKPNKGGRARQQYPTTQRGL